MRHYEESKDIAEVWGQREEDIFETPFEDLEMEWSGSSHTGMHPKKGKVSNSRRYIEEYWENKRMKEIQRDVFDLD